MRVPIQNAMQVTRLAIKNSPKTLHSFDFFYKQPGTIAQLISKQFYQILWGFSILALVGVSSCARFQVEELQSSILLAIEVKYNSDNAYKSTDMPIQKNGYIYYGWPNQALLANETIILTDSHLHQIKIYEQGDPEPQVIIGQNLKQLQVGDQIQAIKMDVGVPGRISFNPNSNKICFEHHANEKALPRINYTYDNLSAPERARARGSLIQHHPSEIYCLNKDYQLDFKVAANGLEGNTAFYAIEDLYQDRRGRLFIGHNELQANRQWQKIISILGEDKQLKSIQLNTLEHNSVPQSSKTMLSIETVVPDQENGSIYYSLTQRYKSTYEPINKYFFQLNKPYDSPRLIMQSDDPTDFLACSSNEGILIQNSNEDGSEILYKNFSLNAEYLKNERVSLEGLRAAWLETWCQPGGSIYSSRIYRGHYEIHEWQ